VIGRIVVVIVVEIVLRIFAFDDYVRMGDRRRNAIGVSQRLQHDAGYESVSVRLLSLKGQRRPQNKGIE
jgi:hypothetical protein